MPLTVEPDGTLIFADGSCRAVVAVDQFLNLSSYGLLDRERVCSELAALVNGLAPAQDLQMVIESNPVQPAVTLDVVRTSITTAHPTLREVAAETLSWLERELVRTHVPALTGYLVVAPAPEPPLGLAGAIMTAREVAGLHAPQHDAERRGLDAAIDDVLMQCKAMDLMAHRVRQPEMLALLWRTINPAEPQPEGLADADDLGRVLVPSCWRECYGEIIHERAAGALYTRSLYVLDARTTTSPGWLGESGQSHLNEEGGRLLGRSSTSSARTSMTPTPDVSQRTHFAALDDPRVERTKQHRLLDILTIALCAMVCGADTWVEIETFGRAKEAWFASFLDLEQGIPSHDTFGRVFARLDPEQFGGQGLLVLEERRYTCGSRRMSEGGRHAGGCVDR